MVQWGKNVSKLLTLIFIFLYSVYKQDCLSSQVETFSGVYKKLTGKDVVFEFPEFQL